MEINYKTGITGNLYVWSRHKCILEGFCREIGKSINSIYWNDKYKNVIRIKDKGMKKRAREVLKRFPPLL